MVTVVLSAMMALAGCPQPGYVGPVRFELDGLQDKLTVVAVTDETIYFSMVPDDQSVDFSTEILDMENIDGWWADGFLKGTQAGLEWIEITDGTGGADQKSADSLTAWHQPLAIDPDEGIIYSLGHTTPPARAIEAHYLDGREFEQIGAIVADIVEPVWPLPSNGWTLFWVDRPNEGGTNAMEGIPTRKLRIYGGSAIGGEFYDVVDYY